MDSEHELALSFSTQDKQKLPPVLNYRVSQIRDNSIKSLQDRDFYNINFVSLRSFLSWLVKLETGSSFHRILSRI